MNADYSFLNRPSATATIRNSINIVGSRAREVPSAINRTDVSALYTMIKGHASLGKSSSSLRNGFMLESES
jgi:hypothetical protein